MVIVHSSSRKSAPNDSHLRRQRWCDRAVLYAGRGWGVYGGASQSEMLCFVTVSMVTGLSISGVLMSAM